ncbi:uncharacterized protein [Panulirus ornatus]|uniref:uncharacterized protein n=1 Tax=Panulirus ornatus TaxID=150431 RepID=UPI003A8B7C17
MARLVWPAMLVLLILAVAGPCLTFYLLIKDYWAEVSSLRRDLLFCQLGSTELPLGFDLDVEAALTSPSSALPLPPAALPLVATTASAVTTTSAGDSRSSRTPPAADNPSSFPSPSSGSPSASTSSTWPSSRPSSSPSPITTSRSSGSPPSLSPSIAKASSSRPVSEDQQMLGDTPDDLLPRRGYVSVKTSQGSEEKDRKPTRNPDQPLVADQSASELTTADLDITDKEYVALLERQLRDLRARVNACRSCLLPPQKKLPTCGGGRAWRDYRRRRRLLRRKEREQRRERRRQERRQGNATNETSSGTTTTPTPQAANITTTTPAPHNASTTPTSLPHHPPTTTPTTTPTREVENDSDTVLADVAYSNPKIDSKRARETHRMSTDFRRGFNQKISRMDEALMQFTDTQAAFCKELRDNLGGRLGKRGQELEALSEQIAALVRTSTDQITALEKVASDQLYAGQASIEKSMAITQAIRDSQLRAIQNYHKQTFLPAAAAIATILTDQASAATSMGVELITKVEMLQDVYLTYATRQADTLRKLAEDVDMFASKHSNLLMRSRDHANHININAENFVRVRTFALVCTDRFLLPSYSCVSLLLFIFLPSSLPSEEIASPLMPSYQVYLTLRTVLMWNQYEPTIVFEIMIYFGRREQSGSSKANHGAMTCLTSRTQGTVIHLFPTLPYSLSPPDSLNSTQAVVDNLSQGLKNRLDNATVLERDFRKIFKRETNQISDRVESGISEALVSNHASVRQIEEAELDTRVFVGTATAAWNELYLNQEAELRKEADALSHSLRAHTHHTQNVLAGMRTAAETHEQVLEEQRMDFQRFIRKRQDALDNQCSAITDWALLMSTELRRRDEDLHRFLSEDLQFATVTVEEDVDGYLVSRLPDGSLMYQSSPGHARPARPTPNVTYQLDETAYSPSLASATSHSSPKKPQLEKTVVTSVNKTRSEFSGSSEFSASSSNSTSEDSSMRSASPSKPLGLPQETDRYDVSEVNHKVNNENSEKETQELDFQHHTKAIRSEGPSVRNGEQAKNKLSEPETGMQVDRNPDDVAYTQVGEGEHNGVQEVIVVSTENVLLTGHTDEGRDKTAAKVLHSRRGELEDSGDRQNDGSYESDCTEHCGRQTGDEETSGVPGQAGESKFTYYDEDEGVKELRKILNEAHVAIQKFQIDFELQGNFREGNMSQKSWALSTNEDVEPDGPHNVTEGHFKGHNELTNSSTSGCGSGKPEEPTTGASAASHDVQEKNSTEGHRVRHHHHKEGRRTSLRPGGGGGIFVRQSPQDTSPPSSSTSSHSATHSSSIHPHDASPTSQSVSLLKTYPSPSETVYMYEKTHEDGGPFGETQKESDNLITAQDDGEPQLTTPAVHVSNDQPTSENKREKIMLSENNEMVASRSTDKRRNT